MGHYEPSILFLHMLMLKYMFSAVAILAITFWAIAEIHVWMGLVSNSAHTATVVGLILSGQSTCSLFRQLPFTMPDGQADIPGKKQQEVSRRSQDHHAGRPVSHH